MNTETQPHFCQKCGTEIKENALFCSNCGAMVSVNTIQSNSSPIQKKFPKKAVVWFCGIISVIIIFACIISNLVPRRVDFNIDYDREAIQDFCEIVCKNANAESAQVDGVLYRNASVTNDAHYNATLSVKLPNMASEEISLEFYNRNDRDRVSKIYIAYYGSNSENQIACKDVIAEAIEISFSGSSEARMHTSQFAATEENRRNTQIISDYKLCDSVWVRVFCRSFGRSGSDDWNGGYLIGDYSDVQGW